MGSQTVFVPRKATRDSVGYVKDDGVDELVSAPESRHNAARGVITGLVLGAGLWGVILVLAGVIKL